MATAPIRPLAWEPPHAVGVALKRTKERKKEKKYIYLIYVIAFCTFFKVTVDNKSHLYFKTTRYVRQGSDIFLTLLA